MLAPALEVVEALRELEIAEDGVPSLFALALHARVCHLTEDHAARRLMDEAVTRAGDDDDLRQDLVNSCGTSAGGRGGGVRRGRAETSRVRVGTPPSTSTCRSRMHAKSVAEHVDEWLTAAAGDPWEAGPPGWLELMAYERLVAGARTARRGRRRPHAEEDNVLAARGRPGDVAGGGRDGPGLVHARYGLWQVRPGAEPRDRVHGRVLPGASSTSRSRRIRSWTCRDGRS